VISKLEEKLLTSFGKSHTVYKEGDKIQIFERILKILKYYKKC